MFQLQRKRKSPFTSWEEKMWIVKHYDKNETIGLGCLSCSMLAYSIALLISHLSSRIPKGIREVYCLSLMPLEIALKKSHFACLLWLGIEDKEMKGQDFFATFFDNSTLPSLKYKQLLFKSYYHLQIGEDAVKI